MTLHDRRRAAPILIVLLAAFCAVVIATGVLTLVLLIAAVLAGNSLGDFYASAFPTFRGPGTRTGIPPLAYAMFVGYVIFAASIAIVCRRRIAERWSREGRARRS